jgi:hypothetical protein
MEGLKSRKLWMAIAGIVGNLLLMFTGAIDSSVGINNIGFIIMTYMGTQGLVDIFKKKQ